MIALAIRAVPTLIEPKRTTDMSTSWPPAIRALARAVGVVASTPARRARSGVITVWLAPVSRRKTAETESFSTTGTNTRLSTTRTGTDVRHAEGLPWKDATPAGIAAGPRSGVHVEHAGSPM